MYQIEFYETSNGRSPVGVWFDELESGNLNDIELLDIIVRKIGWLEEHGLSLGRKHIKCLTKGRKLEYHIWELRIPFNNNTYRIFFSPFRNKIFVLLHKIHKKKQKVDKSDIDKSLKRMKQWVNTVKEDLV